MALRNLTGVSRRQLRERAGRTAVTAAGIALGVAVFFGVTVSNASINGYYGRLADEITGRADVIAQVVGTTDGSSIPGEKVARVRRLPGVAAAAGSLYASASAQVSVQGDLKALGIRPLPGHTLPTGPVTFAQRFGVTGVDFDVAPRIADLPVARGRLARAGAAELVVPARLAAALRAHVGSTFDVSMGGPAGSARPFTVVGIVRESGLGFLTGGFVAYAPLDIVQAAVGRPDVVVNIDIALRPGVRVDRWVEVNRPVFGPEVTVTNAAAALEPLRRTFKAPSQGFLALSTLALWLGLFLIYLTVSMNVLERTRLFGTLFALGATRRQVARLVLTEAGVLGAAGSAVGLVAGLGLSVVLVRLTATWFNLRQPSLVVSPIAVAAGFAAGWIMTVAASLLPARRAASLSPVEALRVDAETAAVQPRTWLVGVPMLVAGTLALPAVDRGTSAVVTISFLVLLGALLTVPLVLPAVAAVLGRATERIGRGTGRVAVMHLAKERNRSALTLGLVMIVLAMVVGFAAATEASKQVNERQLASQFGADLRVFHQSFDQGSLDLVRSTPGVRSTTAIAFASPPSPLVDAPAEPIRIEAIDPTTYFDVAGFAWSDGATADARAALVRGGTVLLPAGTATHLGVRRGGRIRIATRAGPRSFRVAATYVSLVSGPAIVMGESDGRELLAMGRPTEVDVRAAAGHSTAQIRAAIVDRAGQAADFGFSTRLELAANVRAALARATHLYSAVLLVCVLVSMLGVANTLAMSVFERRREIGVLRAVGTGRGAVARMVLAESATLVLAALVLAVPLAFAVSKITIGSVARTFGFTPAFVYPWAALPGLAVLAGVVGIAAALVPARRAAAVDIIDALRLD